MPYSFANPENNYAAPRAQRDTSARDFLRKNAQESESRLRVIAGLYERCARVYYIYSSLLVCVCRVMLTRAVGGEFLEFFDLDGSFAGFVGRVASFAKGRLDYTTGGDAL